MNRWTVGMFYVVLGSGACAQPATRHTDYQLDIPHRHISRTDYHVGERVVVSTPHQGQVDVGASVSAQHIEADLQGVHGHVQFNADLSRLLHSVNRGLPPRPDQ